MQPVPDASGFVRERFPLFAEMGEDAGIVVADDTWEGIGFSSDRLCHRLGIEAVTLAAAEGVAAAKGREPAVDVVDDLPGSNETDGQSPAVAAGPFDADLAYAIELLEPLKEVLPATDRVGAAPFADALAGVIEGNTNVEGLVGIDADADDLTAHTTYPGIE